MSRLRLPKKLQPAKTAWKSFSNTLQSKLHNLKYAPKAIKTTIQRLLSAFHSLRYFIAPSKPPRSLTTPSSYSLSHTRVHRHNLAPIEVKPHAQRETSRGEEAERSGGIDSVEDAWKAVVAKSPVLRVDERAEEFIHKFREDMKLQKERSLLQFQETLARSA